MSTIDASKLNRQLGALHDALIGKGYTGDAANVVRDESRLLLTQAMRFTPPKNLAQGRNAIKQDLLGGRRLGATGAKRSRGIFIQLQSWMPQGESENTVRLWANKKGEVYGVEKQLFRPNASMSEMRQHHLKYRSQKTGRTTLAGNWTRDIGRWKFVNQMAVSKATMAKYLKEVQKRVGFMRAGWVPALVAVGGKAPSWVSRHSKPSGFVVNNLGNTDIPSITIGNTTKGIGRVRSSFEAALRVRSNSIRLKIRRILALHGKNISQGLPVTKQT